MSEQTTTHDVQYFCSDKRIRGSAALVLILLAVFLFAQTIKAFKEYKYIGGGVPAANVISVNGEGEIFAIPDIATFSYSVIEEGTTVPVVQKAAADKINKAKALLLEKGIAEKDIQTTSFDIHPKYEYQQVNCTAYSCPPGQQKAVGFEAVQTDTVKVRKVDSAGELLAALSALGVQNVSGLSFTIDNEDAVKAQARDKAIAQAKDKANALAKSLGVSLVRIVGFSENNQGPMYYSTAKDVRMEMGGAAPAPTAPEISTGQNKIVSNVSITYEIR